MNLSIFFRAGVFNTISEVELAFEGSVWVRLRQKLTERGLSSGPHSTWLPTTGPGVTGCESILQLLNYGTKPTPLRKGCVKLCSLHCFFLLFIIKSLTKELYIQEQILLANREFHNGWFTGDILKKKNVNIPFQNITAKHLPKI